MNFLRRHKILIIGAVLYIVSFIISCFWNPWDSFGHSYSDKELMRIYNIYEVLPHNAIEKIIPLKVVYFGIFEYLRVLEYSEHAGGFGMFIVLSFFTYTMLIKKVIFKKSNMEDMDYPLTLKWLSGYMYGNVICFFTSVIISIFAGLFDNFVFGFIDENINTITSTLHIILIIFAILFAALFALPAIPNGLFMWAYYLVFTRFACHWVNVLGGKFPDNIFGDLIAYILAFVFIMLVNAVMEKFMEFLQSLSLLPAKFIFSKIFRRRTA